MKKLLILLVVLCGFSLAQFQIGLNGGFHGSSQYLQGGFAPGLGISYQLNKESVVGFDYYQINSGGKIGFVGIDKNDEFSTKLSFTDVYYQYFLPVKLIDIAKTKSYLKTGLSLVKASDIAVNTSYTEDWALAIGYSSADFTVDVSPKNGWFLAFGANYAYADDVSFDLELRSTFYNVDINGELDGIFNGGRLVSSTGKTNATQSFLSLTVGVNYHFGDVAPIVEPQKPRPQVRVETEVVTTNTDLFDEPTASVTNQELSKVDQDVIIKLSDNEIEAGKVFSINIMVGDKYQVKKASVVASGLAKTPLIKMGEQIYGSEIFIPEDFAKGDLKLKIFIMTTTDELLEYSETVTII